MTNEFIYETEKDSQGEQRLVVGQNKGGRGGWTGKCEMSKGKYCI